MNTFKKIKLKKGLKAEPEKPRRIQFSVRGWESWQPTVRFQ